MMSELEQLEVANQLLINNSPLLIGVNELSELLGVTPLWIYARIISKYNNAIPCIKIGKYYKFNISEVMEWLEQQNERM